MFDWAEKMIENMKEHGEIKTTDNEGGDNTIKLSDSDLQKISQIIIQQLNNENNSSETEHNENESEE